LQERKSAGAIQTMKYSELDSYREYIEAKAQGDNDRAELMLQRCLENLEIQQSPSQTSDLWQRLGEARYLRGDAAGALDCMKRAEAADPSSLLVKLYFAEFLGLRLGNKTGAVAKCDLIIDSTKSQPFAETDDDFGSEHYRRKAEELKQKLT
jgi:tetratricopeptide (TPR) repeat protein